MTSLSDDTLDGRIAVVTGAAGGIGSAVAEAFAAAGASVVGLDREQADLSEAESVEHAFASLDRFDVLVNCLGISGRRLGDGPVESCTEEAWDAVLDANLKSVYLCCRQAIPRLRAAGGGAIVNVSSVLGLVGGDEDFATHAYAASKAGVIGLSRAIAAHYAGESIRCNVIAPGPHCDADERAGAERRADPGAPARAPAAVGRVRSAG